MIGPLRILPLLIIVAMLAFSVRLTEVVTGISNLSASAYAEEKTDAPNEPAHPGDTLQGHGDADGEGQSPVQVVDEDEAQAPKWRDATDADIDVTGVKMEMFEDLSERRKELKEQEKKLQVREALLKAAEQELDRKYQELTKIREEIKALLEKHSEEEEKRIESLVKIYEGMKPKDAARIFDTLDIDVLVSVMSKMSERRVAPILAAMNPERARTVTIMLAEEKKLPTLR